MSILGQDKPVGNVKFGIGLDGFDETLNTLDKVNKAFKVSESNLKTVLSTFDKASTSTENLARKQEALAQVTELQSKKLDILGKRRDDYIKKYGEESKQVSSVTTQINNATTKYNKYATQLDATKKAYVNSANGVDELSKSLKENEKQTAQEVKALRESGDAAGAAAAKTKGLTQQQELNTKIIKAQEKVVEDLTKEYGANSKEVGEASKRLDSYKRQQKLTSTQLDATKRNTKEAKDETSKLNSTLKNTEDAAGSAVKGLSKISDGTSKLRGGTSKLLGGISKLFGGVGFGALLSAGNKAFNGITSSVDGAINRIDTLANSTRAFQNMGFGEGQTKKAMENISKAIEGLPTALNDSVSNVQLLAASTGDLDKSVDVYKALNDAILGFGGDANMAQNAIVQLSQAFSNGKVDAQTWNSMINSGLGPTLNAMAKKMGITTGELKKGLSEGTISVSDFQKSLIELDKNGGGGLKALDQIAKDSTKGISTSIANAKTAMVRGTAELIKGVDNLFTAMNLPSISEMITNSGKTVESLFKGIASAAPAVGEKLSFVGDAFKYIGTWIENLKMLWNGDGVITLNTLGLDIDEVFKVSDAVENLKGAVDGLFSWLENIPKMWKGESILNLSTLGLNTQAIFEVYDSIDYLKSGVDNLVGWFNNIKGMFNGDRLLTLDTLGLDYDTMFKVYDAIDLIKESFGNLKDFLMEPFNGSSDNGLSGFIDKIGVVLEYVTTTLIPMVLPPLSKFISTATKLFIGFRNIISSIVDYIVKNIVPLLIPIIEKIFSALGNIFDKISNWWDQNGDRIGKAILNLLQFLQPIFKIAISLVAGFVDSVIGFIDGMVDFITGVIDVFAMALTGDFTGLWDAIKRIFLGGIKAIYNWISILFVKNIVGSVKGMGTSFLNIIKNLWSGIQNFFKNGISVTFSGIKGWATNIGNGVKGIKDTFVTTMSNLWEGVKGVFSGGISTITEWIKNLPSQLADGITKGVHFVQDAFKAMFNGVLRTIGAPVNAIIGGANWVLKKLGADELETWEVPQYENGTPTGGHPGGLMMVNDGRGAEMVIPKKGAPFIPQGKNVVMNAGKGTHVLTAEETAAVTGGKAPKYKYAKGTGFWDSFKSTVGNITSSISDKIGDIFEYATNPAKLVSKVFDSLGILDGLAAYPLKAGKAILSKATSAMISKVKGLFDSGGNLDLGTGTLGTYKYLADVAQKVMSRYSGFVATSGYRPGDPYSHGKRNAIDIAIPGVTNGSTKYKQAGDYAFNQFASKVGYVIANNRVKDRSGQSGTGIHSNWTNWAEGGHMDHVHINGIKDPQSKQATDENFTGNVSAYSGIATRALQMTGQYTKANLNALLNQMRTESNGNARAINNWDINAKNGTPSKGLMQVIDPTFRAYAMKGYNSNIYDPLSNILASIRYTLARYGSLTAGWRGVGYENGGLITKQHLAMVGEKNRPEMVIPLHQSKRSRALELLAQTQSALGVGENTSLVSSTSDNSLLAQLLQQQIQTNQLLQAILGKDSNVYLDKNKLVGQLAPSIDRYNTAKTRTSNRLAGSF